MADPSDPEELTDDQFDALTGEWDKHTADLGDLSPELKKTLRQTRKHLDTVRSSAGEAAGLAEFYADDDTMPPDARRRLADEARQSGTKKVDEAAGNVTLGVDVAAKRAAEEAMPKPDLRREQLQREEFRDWLDHVDDNPAAALTELASDETLAAVAASSYGQRLLNRKSRGLGDQARRALLEATAEGKRGSKQQQAAAKLALRKDKLSGLAGTAKLPARDRIGGK